MANVPALIWFKIAGIWRSAAPTHRKIDYAAEKFRCDRIGILP